MRLALLFLAFICAAQAVQAEVSVEERILQKGLFVKTDCEPDPQDPSYNGCECDADVRYPEIKGMADGTAESALNAALKHAAQQSQCEGVAVKEAPKPAGGKDASPSSASHHYEVTFQSPALLGLEFTDWGYSGGAHGNGSVTGLIIDLEKARILTLKDLFAAKDMAAVNAVIYAALSARPEGEVFHDQIESRKGAFISDRQCQGCTLTLTPAGIKVLFQTYEVASYAAGNTEVLIPSSYIAYPAIVTALAQQEPAAPEKK